MITLYDYFRSTASYRVRIALNIKGLNADVIPVHLVEGQQKQPQYLELNPQGLVPTLLDDGQVLTQSIAIIEYLDECYKTPALLPTDPVSRARVRQLALSIACDIHPLNNLRVLNQLRTKFSATDEAVTEWYHHWLKAGFDAFEQTLESLDRGKPVCVGHEVSMADICLIPQVYNANRFKFDMSAYPLIQEINEYCLTLDVFKDAAP